MSLISTGRVMKGLAGSSGSAADSRTANSRSAAIAAAIRSSISCSVLAFRVVFVFTLAFAFGAALVFETRAAVDFCAASFVSSGVGMSAAAARWAATLAEVLVGSTWVALSFALAFAILTFTCLRHGFLMVERK